MEEIQWIADRWWWRLEMRCSPSFIIHQMVKEGLVRLRVMSRGANKLTDHDHLTMIKQNNFDADLIIGFKIYKEIYSSRIFLDNVQNIIKVEYKDGPFERLENHWIFKENNEGCKVEFMVDFKFKSVFLQTIMETLFSEAVKRMVKAFETRANELYT